jgi:hypothetical protein
VLKDAVDAGKRLGAIFKEPTVTIKAIYLPPNISVYFKTTFQIYLPP